MAVRFILGRAGTGKTHHCLEAVRARLRQNPVDGPRLILLVPEQAALQMERLLIETADVSAFARCEVLSFRRLAYRVLQVAGDAGRVELSAVGRMMVLRHLLQQHQHELAIYRRVLSAPGFAGELAHSIVELLHEQIAPEQLGAAAAQIDGAAARARLLDLSRVYRAYLDYLGDRAVDPAQALDAAAERLADTDWGTGAEVWVDGFAGFTALETAMLVTLARRAVTMHIALLLDPDDVADVGDSDALWREFAATERTHARLRRLLAEHGVPVEGPLALRPPEPPRFARKAALIALERHVLAAEPGPQVFPGSEPQVELFSFSNRRDEVAAALTRVQDLVRRDHDPLRYRDIALIVRDLAPYHDLIAAEGAERGIPVFIDRRRPMTHHPLVELIRGLCAVPASDFSAESVRLLLKSGLLPLGDDALDELENYLLAWGINGRELWLRREWGWWGRRSDRPDELAAREQRMLRKVNETRRALVHAIRPWLDLCGEGARHTGREWAVGLEHVLHKLDVPRRLEQMAVVAEERGRPVTAQEHRQIWPETMTLLEDFERGLGAAPMGVAELAQALDAGLAELTLGLAPPTLDQVLVGDIERSRHPPLRAVLLLGMNERQFPRCAQERPLLADDDRAALARAGVMLSAVREQSLVQERYLGYVALTRASDYLWLSYPAADEQGRELFPSPLLESVRRAVPGVAERRVDTGAAGRAMVMIGSAAALAGRLALDLGERRSPAADEPARRAEWNLLYERARTDKALHAALRPALRSLVYENKSELDARGLKLLAVRPLRGSVTRLETFAACPFQHYARYLLRLDEREEHTLEALELGTLAHGVLERFIGELIDEQCTLHDADSAQVQQRLGELAVRVARDLHEEILLGEARNRYLIERCSTDLAQSLRGQRAWSRATRLRPRAVELPFGMPEREGSLPALVITTPKGRRLEIRGLIDRVDLAEVAGELLAVVIDYKRSRERRLDLYRVHHGLSLQLLTYLLVLLEHGHTWLGRAVSPIGAFYVKLRGAPQRVNHPREIDTIIGELGEELADAEQARGLLDYSRLDVIDAGVVPGGRSVVVSAQCKKETGGPANLERTDVADADQFRAVLDSVRATIARLGDESFDGAIDIAPYRLGTEVPCTWCPYRSVCRFDYQLNRARTLRRLSRVEVLGVEKPAAQAENPANNSARARKSKKKDERRK